MRRFTLGRLLVLSLAAVGCASQRDEPGRRAGALAARGFELYSAGRFAASHAGGWYTDPDPDTRAREFWSDGSVAKVDAHGDGHYETIYLVREGRLDYVGRLGRGDGRFVATGRAYRHLAGLTLGEAGLGKRTRTRTPPTPARDAARSAVFDPPSSPR